MMSEHSRVIGANAASMHTYIQVRGVEKAIIRDRVRTTHNEMINIAAREAYKTTFNELMQSS